MKEIVAVIETGGALPAPLDRLDELERQKAETEARLRHAPEDDLPEMDPVTAGRILDHVGWLGEMLKEEKPSPAAVQLFRSLIGEIMIMPGEKRGAFNARSRPRFWRC